MNEDCQLESLPYHKYCHKCGGLEWTTTPDDENIRLCRNCDETWQLIDGRWWYDCEGGYEAPMTSLLTISPQTIAAFHPDADDVNSLSFWSEAALGQSLALGDALTTIDELRQQVADLKRSLNTLQLLIVSGRNQRVRLKNKPEREGTATISPIIEVRWDGGSQMFINLSEIEPVPEGNNRA